VDALSAPSDGAFGHDAGTILPPPATSLARRHVSAYMLSDRPLSGRLPQVGPMSAARRKIVAHVEIEDIPQSIDCAPEGAEPYEAAWILVRCGGRPIGNIEIVPKDGMISAVDLQAAIAAGFPRTEQISTQARVSDDLLPSATVIVPTALARLEQLDASIAHLRRLDHPSFEIIIVDNRPAGTPTAQIDGVRVVREERPGISAARNAGLAVATGEIIAFTDDDVEVDRGWLTALAERFVREPGLSAVSGLVVPYELETPAQVWFEESGLGLYRQYSPLTFEYAGCFKVRRIARDDGDERIGSLYATGEFGLGSNMAFRVEVLREAGGFDLALGAGTATSGGEDLAMLVGLLANGHTLAYQPSAVVFHKHRRTAEELRRQAYGYGTGLTAMITAITLRDPRHVVGLAGVLPAWARSLSDDRSAKRVNRTEGYPSDLGRRELLGMAMGPFTYMRARRAQRRWRP
jgi:GT2 family glycosyltransferase